MGQIENPNISALNSRNPGYNWVPSGEGEINNKHLGRMRFKEEKRDTRHLLGILVYPWYLDLSQERDHGKKFWVTTKIKK